jgi:hypothetical protein
MIKTEKKIFSLNFDLSLKTDIEKKEMLEEFIRQRRLKKISFGKIIKEKKNFYLLIPNSVFHGKKHDQISFSLKEKEVGMILNKPCVFNSCRFFRKKNELKVELKKYVKVYRNPEKNEKLRLIKAIQTKGLNSKEVLEWKKKARKSLREC